MLMVKLPMTNAEALSAKVTKILVSYDLTLPRLVVSNCSKYLGFSLIHRVFPMFQKLYKAQRICSRVTF